ncbi:MAG: FCD domain-containing protein [Cellvibrionaceae bacterium]
MQFDQINTKSVADSVSEQVKHLILGGGLKPGEKLPSERILATEFNVSRMSLRQGISLLIDIGLLEARKDGTYVCDVISPSLVGPFSQLFSWYPKALHDMLELRLLLQTKAIELAIERSCDSDKDILEFFYDRMQLAFETKKIPEIIEAVKELHLAIIDCSYNLVLATVLRGILSLLQSSLKDDIGKEHLSKYQFIQECLYKAVIQGDSGIANDMLERHIEMVKSFSLLSSKVAFDQLSLNEQPSQSYRIDKAVARIEHLIICQHFEASKALPDLLLLSKEVGESEDVVNAALKVLLEKDILSIEKGKLCVATNSSKPLISDPLAHLINTDWKVALDVFELRIILERNSSYQAAENENYDKRNYLKTCLSRLLANDDDYNAHSNALDDYEFHLAIADLSENLATTYLMRGLFNLLRGSISSWLALFNKEVGDISIIQRQHINICDAILANTPNNASEAMREHLQYVITTVQRIAARKERETYAQQRWRYIENKYSLKSIQVKSLKSKP